MDEQTLGNWPARRLAKRFARDFLAFLANSARILSVAADLSLKFFEPREFLFWPKILEKGDFDVLSVDFLIKVEKVQFKEPFAALVLDGGADADVHHAAIFFSV